MLQKKTHDNNKGLQKLSLRVSYRTIIYMHWHSKSRCISIYIIYIYVCVCVHIYTDIHVHTCMCNVMFLSSSPRQKCSKLQKRWKINAPNNFYPQGLCFSPSKHLLCLNIYIFFIFVNISLGLKYNHATFFHSGHY